MVENMKSGSCKPPVIETTIKNPLSTRYPNKISPNTLNTHESSWGNQAKSKNQTTNQPPTPKPPEPKPYEYHTLQGRNHNSPSLPGPAYTPTPILIDMINNIHKSSFNLKPTHNHTLPIIPLNMANHSTEPESIPTHPATTQIKTEPPSPKKQTMKTWKRKEPKNTHQPNNRAEHRGKRKVEYMEVDSDSEEIGKHMRNKEDSESKSMAEAAVQPRRPL